MKKTLTPHEVSLLFCKLFLFLSLLSLHVILWYLVVKSFQQSDFHDISDHMLLQLFTAVKRLQTMHSWQTMWHQKSDTHRVKEVWILCEKKYDTLKIANNHIEFFFVQDLRRIDKINDVILKETSMQILMKNKSGLSAQACQLHASHQAAMQVTNVWHSWNYLHEMQE